MIPSVSGLKNSFVNYFKLSAVAEISAIAAVKTAQYLRSYNTNGMTTGIICGPSFGDYTCQFGSIGKTNILCAERINWLQPAKPIFVVSGTFVNLATELPAYLLGFEEKSVMNVSLAAIGEEVCCRSLLQKVLLRKLQEKIIMQFSKNPKALIDHPIMKLSRIAAASIIFGLMHKKVWECTQGGTIPEIAAGIIFGVLAETNYGLTASCLAHISANLIIG